MLLFKLITMNSIERFQFQNKSLMTMIDFTIEWRRWIISKEHCDRFVTKKILRDRRGQFQLFQVEMNRFEEEFHQLAMINKENLVSETPIEDGQRF